MFLLFKVGKLENHRFGEELFVGFTVRVYRKDL